MAKASGAVRLCARRDRGWGEDFQMDRKLGRLPRGGSISANLDIGDGRRKERDYSRHMCGYRKMWLVVQAGQCGQEF